MKERYPQLYRDMKIKQNRRKRLRRRLALIGCLISAVGILFLGSF